MQEELEDQGYLSLRAATMPTPEKLIEMGITGAVITYHPETRQLRLDSFVQHIPGADNIQARHLNCIRDNTKAALFLDGELYQGMEACQRCRNCMTCVTKNTTKDFILNDPTLDSY